MLDYYSLVGEHSPNRSEFLDGLRIFSFTWHEQHCILYFENKTDEIWATGLKLSNMYNVKLAKKHRISSNCLDFEV